MRLRGRGGRQLNMEDQVKYPVQVVKLRYSIVGTHCDSAVTIKFIECLVRKSRETNAKEYLSKGLLHLIHFMQCMTLLSINFRIVEIIIRNHHNVRYCVLCIITD